MEMEDARGRTKHALGYLKALQAQNKFALACVKGQVNYEGVLIGDFSIKRTPGVDNNNVLYSCR
jgi:hypothetical protein